MSEMEQLTIDATDLICVSVDYKKLQLFMRGVLDRLQTLENKSQPEVAASDAPVAAAVDQVKHDADVDRLSQEIAALRDAQRSLADSVGQSARAPTAAEKPVASGPDMSEFATKGDLKDLAAKLADHEQRIAELEALAAAQRGIIDDLKRDRIESPPTAAAPLAPEATISAEDLGRTNDKVAGLEARLDDLAKELGSVRDDVAVRPIKDDVENLRRRCDDLDDRVGNLQGGVAGLNSRLRALEGIVAMLQPQGSEGADQLSTFTDTLREIMDRQSDADRKIGSLQNAAADQAAKNDEVASQLQSLRDAVGGYDAKGGDAKLSQLIDDLRAQIAKLPTHNDVNAALKAATLHHSAAPPAAPTTPGLDEGAVSRLIAKALEGVEKEVTMLQRQLASLSEAAAPSASGDVSGVSPQQFAMVKGSVEGLEKVVGDLASKLRALSDAVDKHREDTSGRLDKCGHEIKALGNETSSLADKVRALDAQKADLSQLLALGQRVEALEGQARDSKDRADWKGLQDINRRADDLQKLFAVLDAKINNLQHEKAPKDLLAQLQSEVDRLRAQVQNLLQNKGTKQAAADDSGAAVSSEVLEDINARLSEVAKQLSGDRDWARQQLVEIRATIDHVHHSKADAALVANKAERDYVENAMEKLMREVEQVLNATNAGLIDTLDKSLNILRDMIDGKATKADMAKLQQLIGEESAGQVPEGLAGYKSYRCLGCNRPMEDMRQRPMGASSSAFINRIPGSNQRAKPLTPSAPAGYLAPPPS